MIINNISNVELGKLEVNGKEVRIASARMHAFTGA